DVVRAVPAVPSAWDYDRGERDGLFDLREHRLGFLPQTGHAGRRLTVEHQIRGKVVPALRPPGGAMESAKPLAASLGRCGPVGGPPGADYVVHRQAFDLLFEAHAQRGQPAEGGGNRMVRRSPEAIPAQPPHGVEHIRAVVRVDLADQFVLAGPCIYEDGDRAAILAATNGLDARLMNCA